MQIFHRYGSLKKKFEFKIQLFNGKNLSLKMNHLHPDVQMIYFIKKNFNLEKMNFKITLT